MKWFRRTPKTYDQDTMMQDHFDTVAQAFPEGITPVSVEEQIAMAEAELDEDLFKDDNGQV